MIFEKRSLALVVMLYFLTGGLYGIYWVVRNGYAMNGIDAKHRIAVLPTAMLGTLLMFAFVVMYQISNVTAHMTSQPIQHFGRVFAVAGVCAALFYLLAAVTSARISKQIRAYAQTQQEEKCSAATAVILTIAGFTSAIYLQYHINRLP